MSVLLVYSQLTREALPRLDNYRNILSIQAAHRPTLDELHNASMSNKVLLIICSIIKFNYKRIGQQFPKFINKLQQRNMINYVMLSACTSCLSFNC